jgi:outer membrane biosynthesis protein TonB
MAARATVQVTFRWKGRVLAYRLLGRREVVSIGATKGVTFVTPRLEGFPARFTLLQPVKDGVRLNVGPGMQGKVVLRGQTRTLGEVLAQPAERRLLRDPGMFRHVELYPGDSAGIDLDDKGELHLQISFSEAAPRVAPPPVLPDPLLVRSVAGTAAALTIIVTFLRLFAEFYAGNDQVLTQDKLTRVKPLLASAPVKEAQEKEKRRKEQVAAEARKKQEKEAAESKRAREKEGRIGREDAPNRETVIPKGREDVLRAKVAKTGILAALGNSRPSGSGLARLFDTNDRADIEQAVNGMAGAQLVAGKGNGGLGVAGSGLGGGGTGFGHIQGSGNLDVGAGRGRGRKGPALGRGREKEVKVGLETGNAQAEGGLTRDQVERVVRAHRAAIQYCYEKELQRQPSLSGKVELYWLIKANGTVDRIKVAVSTLESRAVEGCMERQVRNWQFPRSDSETIVQSFPFFFKGSQ